MSNIFMYFSFSLYIDIHIIIQSDVHIYVYIYICIYIHTSIHMNTFVHFVVFAVLEHRSSLNCLVSRLFWNIVFSERPEHCSPGRLMEAKRSLHERSRKSIFCVHHLCVVCRRVVCCLAQVDVCEKMVFFKNDLTFSRC